ncbi:MAG: tetratricopeptide repeat protein [Thermodesulfobacteriota bacterium]
MDKKSKTLDRAQKYIEKGYLDKAIDEYRKVLDMSPGDVSTRLRVGDLFVKTGKQEDAINEYHETARTLTKKGFYLKAIAVYKQISKLDPPNIDIRYRLAELYARQNLIADAISEYDLLARHFESKGRREDTLNIIKKMHEIDPENVGIRLRLAEIYEQSGFQEDAVTEYGNAAALLVENGKHDKAEKLFQTLYDKGVKQPMVLEGLREISKEKGDNEQFLHFSRELIALYDDLGDEEKKRDACERLLEVSPDDRETLGLIEGMTGGEEAPSEMAGVEEERDEEKPVKEGKGEEPHVSLPESEVGVEGVVGEAGAEEEVEGAPQGTGELREEREEEGGEDEEPLIPWSEMIEVEEEPEPTEEQLTEEDEVGEEAVETDLEEVEELEEVEGIEIEEEAGEERVDESAEGEPVEEIAELAPADLEELPELEEEASVETEPIEEAPVEAEPLEEVVEDVEEHHEAVEEVVGGEEEEEEPVTETVEAEEEPGELESAIDEAMEEVKMSDEAIEGIVGSEEGPEPVVETAAEAVEEESGALEGVEETEAVEEVEEGAEGVSEGAAEGGETPVETGYVDLTSELGLGGVEGREEVRDEFKNGIERQLNREDTETHYNMGIAYMEMEMYDEAVKEFLVARRDPEREFDCQIRLGLSYMATGNPQEAIPVIPAVLLLRGGRRVRGRGSCMNSRSPTKVPVRVRRRWSTFRRSMGWTAVSGM